MGARHRLGPFVLGLLACSVQVLSAQEADPHSPTPWEGGIGIVGAAPTGAFADHVTDAAGLSGNFGRRLGKGVITLGGEIAYYWYGHESRQEPFSPTIPDAGYTVTTDNNILTAHGRLRAQMPTGRFRPYADALLGFRDIYTRTSVDLEGLDEISGSGAVTRRVNLRDFGVSYGYGGGVMIGFGPVPSQAKLDVSVRYVAGSEANYLTEGAIRRESGVAFLDTSRSRTDMLTVFVGVSWSAF